MNGIIKFVWIAILGGLFMVYMYLYPALGMITDVLQSTNTTWSVNGTDIATTSPTSELIAQSWKYMMFIVFAGGIIYLMFRIVRKDK
jgi:hypothetical protein